MINKVSLEVSEPAANRMLTALFLRELLTRGPGPWNLVDVHYDAVGKVYRFFWEPVNEGTKGID